MYVFCAFIYTSLDKEIQFMVRSRQEMENRFLTTLLFKENNMRIYNTYLLYSNIFTMYIVTLYKYSNICIHNVL